MFKVKICLFVKWRLFRSSYRKLAWAEFKPTTITGHKWLMTHKVLISCRSKIKVIYILSRLSPQWRRGNSCTSGTWSAKQKRAQQDQRDLRTMFVLDQLWPVMTTNDLYVAFGEYFNENMDTFYFCVLQ